MVYSPEVRIDYAVSLLQDDIFYWWEMVPNSTIRPWVLTYTDFVQTFRDNYMPLAYQNEKLREFTHLKQGDMTVAQYEVKFN